MAKTKRAPISYTGRFGGDLFRPRETVAEELLQPAPIKPSSRTNGRTDERRRIRHSFDVYHDQLLALADIQTAQFAKNGRKPTLGELVQEALDTYIAERKG